MALPENLKQANIKRSMERAFGQTFTVNINSSSNNTMNDMIERLKSKAKAEIQLDEQYKAQKDSRSSTWKSVAQYYSTGVSCLARINQGVGNYTGNKYQQKAWSNAIEYGSSFIFASVFMHNPTVGLLSIGTKLINERVQNEIGKINASEEAKYNRSMLGNMATSGSKWKGANL